MALASEAPTSVFPTSRVFLNFEPLNLMFAIVDLETTGGIPENDQIIEVAIYHHDGEKITGSWSSLINPETVIPPFIARLTGISDVMVQKAPLFSAVAPQIAEMLTDRIFVAHNVMFDYSFLTHHLEQHGFPPIEHRLFCTCHSGRKLLPGYPSYSLGKLCRSLGITTNGAHRAAADVEATIALLERMLEKTEGNLTPYLQQQRTRDNYSKITAEQLNATPSLPGVIYFYDRMGELLYVTRADNMKKKAWKIVSNRRISHFMHLAEKSHSLGHQGTGGLIEAAILEVEDNLRLRPSMNRRFKFKEARKAIYDELDEKGFLNLNIGPFDGEREPVIVFTSASEAKETLLQVRSEFSIHDNKGRLFNEDPDSYNQRVEAAIEKLKTLRKNFIILEKGAFRGSESAIIVSNGAYRGTLQIDPQENISLADASAEVLGDRLQRAVDTPPAMNTIIRMIARGDYKKIIPFQ